MQVMSKKNGYFYSLPTKNSIEKCSIFPQLRIHSLLSHDRRIQYYTFQQQGKVQKINRLAESNIHWFNSANG